MKNSRRKFLLQISTAIAVAASPKLILGGGGLTGGSTEPTQLLNNAELMAILEESAAEVALMAEQISQQIMTVHHLLNSYNNFVKNTLEIPLSIWNKVKGIFSTIKNVIHDAQGLIFRVQNLDQEYKKIFQDFDTKMAFEVNQAVPVNWNGKYRTWSKNLNDTLINTLEQAKLQYEQFEDEQSMIEELESMSRTAEGRMQALQAGNQIATVTVQQLQKLRVLMISQMNAYAQVEATKHEHKMTTITQQRRVFKKDNSSVRVGNESSY